MDLFLAIGGRKKEELRTFRQPIIVLHTLWEGECNKQKQKTEKNNSAVRLFLLVFFFFFKFWRHKVCFFVTLGTTSFDKKMDSQIQRQKKKFFLFWSSRVTNPPFFAFPQNVAQGNRDSSFLESASVHLQCLSAFCFSRLFKALVSVEACFFPL